MVIPFFFFFCYFPVFFLYWCKINLINLMLHIFVINCYSHLSFPSMAEDAELTPLLRLGAGACAGIIAMSATYPMDMVRGRLTVQVFWRVSIDFEFIQFCP